MLKLVLATDYDGLDVRTSVFGYFVPNVEFDFMAAVKAAAIEYCQTEEGKKCYEHNCNEFNWGDFDTNVPEAIMKKHGFSRADLTALDIIDVQFYDQLIQEEDVFPEGTN